MTLTDYSALEEEIKNAPEPELLPDNSEVKARIIDVKTGETEKRDNARWYSVIFDVPDQPLCPMFSDFFWELADKDKIGEKAYMQALRQFRDFANSFNIDYSRPFSWVDDLAGLEGWMVLKIVKDKSGEYPDKNGVKKYVTSK